VLTLAVLVAALAAVASSERLHDLVVRAVGIAQGVITAHPIWGLSLFVVFSAVSAMLAFFSTAVITPVAVQTWGEPASIALLWIGWMLGGAGAYAIGRLLGRPVVRALTSADTLARFESRLSRHAPFGFVLLFQFALPSEVPGYVLGLARYHFFKYLLVLAIAELPFAVVTVYLGTSLLEQRTSTLLMVGAAGVALVAWAVYSLQKRLSTP
jgi:uncharacterized membrane protein YdjX (TVP38/TMEM64 family)